MCKNMGSIDRVIRLIIAAVALGLAFTTLKATGGAVPGILVAVVGVVMLLTAALGFCPLYLPLKLSTCKASSR